MWVGRNFIDFVHPQDRDTFINQVTENLGLILRDIHSTPGPARKKDTSYCKSGSFYCRIRIYNGLRSGFTVKERKTRFAPFKLSVCFLEMDCKVGYFSIPILYIFQILVFLYKMNSDFAPSHDLLVDSLYKTLESVQHLLRSFGINTKIDQ